MIHLIIEFMTCRFADCAARLELCMAITALLCVICGALACSAER